MRPNLNDKIMEAKSFLEDKGYKVAYIWIYGSQNYDLDIYNSEYTSDIDYKAVIIPSLDDLVYNSKPLSTTLTYEDWQIDLKDIRVFTDTLVKCNPAYLEILYTEFCWYNEDYEKIIFEKESLVAEMWEFLLRACYWMILEKVKAFSHPYPTTAHKIEKYWYDPKQLHHIVRLYFLMNEYIKTWRYNMSNLDYIKELLLDIKIWKIDIEEAKELRNFYSSKAKELRDNYIVEPKFYTKDRIISLSREVLKNSIISEIKWIKKKTVLKTNNFNKLPNM